MYNNGNTSKNVTGASIVDGTIANADVDASAAIATSKLSGAVTSITSHGLATSATTDTTDASNISTGTLPAARIAADGLSGDKIDGGTISNFASTGIDDNAPSTAMTIDSQRHISVFGGGVSSHWNAGYDVFELGSEGCGFTTRFNDELCLRQSAAYGTYVSTGKAVSGYTMANGVHYFNVAGAGTEGDAITWDSAVRINNDSQVFIGTTSWLGSGTSSGLSVSGGGGGPYVVYVKNADASGGANMLQFLDGSGDVCGGIVSNATSNTTAYQTSSDYRLKENVTSMTGSIDRLKALKPCNFNFITAPDILYDGFLAHEAQEVVPESVTTPKDAMRIEEYEVTPALGEVFIPAVEEVTEERQVMETIETGTYVNLAGETITETSEVGKTIEVTTTVIERQDIEGVMTEVEVEKVSQEPVMETVVTTEAVAEVILESNVEKPEEDNWRETTPAEMGTREVEDYQGIDQSKLVPLLVSALQEAITRIEQLENN